jgi:hypothetical protein
MISISGSKSSVYAWAAIHEMVSTIKANMWTLKFKTRLYATGTNAIVKLDKIVESDESEEEEEEEEKEA